MEDLDGKRVLYFSPYILGVIFTVVSLPLALGLVEPNGAYGIRIPETMESVEVWYSVNNAGGISMIAFAILSMVATFLFHKYWGADSEKKLVVPLIMQAFLILLSIGVAMPNT